MSTPTRDKPTADKPTEESLWAGPSGERWLANVDCFEATLRPIGEALVALAGFRAGDTVIEIGCGAGATSIDIAGRVAPGGSVTGIDISPGLIAAAARRAAPKKELPVRFMLGDAATIPLPAGQADWIVSRFGVMFFSNPYTAFAHLHGLLKPTGRLAIACWAPLKENLWMREVRGILASHVDLPAPVPRASGPFAFDDPDYPREILGRAGFNNIEFVSWKNHLLVGGGGSDPQIAADFLLKALFIAQLGDEVPETLRKLIRQQVVERLQAFMTPAGVSMPASAWLVTASA
jgi:SAM-dependent methyltransferase